MEAAAVGVALVAAVVFAGSGVAARPAGNSLPLALASVTMLAAFVVVTTDAASLVGFSAWLAATTAAALLAPVVWRGRALFGEPRRLVPSIAALPAGVLAGTALVLVAPLLILPVPLDTDAQGFGHLALAVRDGGTIDTLAPWRPGIAYLYAPGALLLFASASALGGGASLPAVMMGVGHACAFLFVWLAWDLGHEIGRCAEATTRLAGEDSPGAWPWATLVGAALSVGLWTALLDAHYTAVAGLLFTLAFVTALFRFVRTGDRRDAWVAGLTLAAVLVTHPDSTMIAVVGLGAFVVASLVAAGRARIGRSLTAGALAASGALLMAAPWLATLPGLLRSGAASPFAVSGSHWRQLLLYHGVFWPLLALVGAVVWLRRRSAWAVMMVIWLAATVELSTLGWLHRTWPALMAPVVRFHFPFSLAWHGPVIPYVCLGAGALVWFVRHSPYRTLPVPGAKTLVATAIAVAAFVFASDRVLDASRGFLTLYGAFATRADVRAMEWVRDHTPRSARVLNYPGDYDHRRDWEGHWAPVVTERDCVYFRMQPFFTQRRGRGAPGDESSPGRLAAARAEQRQWLAFWRDPADPSHAARLRAAAIGIVLVPESIADPSSVARSWRWRSPAALDRVRSTPARAPYLRLVHRDGGALVYEVVPLGEDPSEDATPKRSAR